MSETIIRLGMTMDEMLTFGPTLPIVATYGERSTKTSAQLDTGAGHSYVHPSLVAELSAPTVQSETEYVLADREPEFVPIARLKVRLDARIELEADFAVKHFGEPHRVLLGRDFLANCRLVVDFDAGWVELHVRHA